MPDDLEVKGSVTIRYDPKGAKGAATDLEGVAKGAGVASERLKGAETAASGFHTAMMRLGAYLSVTALGMFSKSAVELYATTERAWAALSETVKRLGINAGEALPKIEAFLDSFKTQNIKDLVPVFDRLLGITRDYRAAMYLTGLAADISEKNQIALGEAASLLAQILQGRVVGAATALNIQLDKTKDAAEQSADVLRKAEEQYGGFAKAAGGVVETLDRAGVAWTKFKTEAGSGIGGLLEGMERLGISIDNALKLVKTFALSFEIGFVGMASSVLAVGKTIASVFNFSELAKGPEAYWNNIKETAVRAFEDVKFFTEGAVEEYRAIWKKGGEESAADLAEGQRKATELANRLALEAQQEALAKEAEERAKAEAKQREEYFAHRAEEAEEDRKRLAKRLADQIEFNEMVVENLRQRLERERELQDQATDAEGQARIAAIEQEIAEREAANQEIWDLLRERLDEELAIELEAARRQYESEIAQKDLTEAAKLALEDRYNAQRLAAEAKHGAARVRLVKAEEDAKKQMYLDAAKTVVGSLRSIFGESKAVAVAEAIINTYEGITKALATYPWPYSAAVAALVGAAGFANVRKIMSTEPGTGGAGGASGGGESAASAAVSVGSTFRPGREVYPETEPEPARPTSQSNESYELHFHGPVVGGEAGAQELVRFLKGAVRRDRGRYQS